MKTLILSFILIFMSGCSTYSVNRYAISSDNVIELRKLGDTMVNVGEFTSSTHKSEIMCRGVGPIKTPDGDTFAHFIKEALIDELQIAEQYSNNADVTITGNLDSIDFSSNSGLWSLTLTANSTTGESVTISENYSYKTSFYGETACNQTAQALMPAVQNLIANLINHPHFDALVGVMQGQGKSSNPNSPASEVFVGMNDQFVISLPTGWSAFDQLEVLTGKRAKTGPPVIFSAVTIDGRAMLSGDQQALRKVMDQMADVELGRTAGFTLQRLRAKRGMFCAGFDSNATKQVLELLGTDAMFGKGRTIREKPHADPIAIGGCQGLRVRGKGTARTGDGKILDVFAVSDGEVLYLAAMYNLDEYYPSNVSAFEQAMSTFRLTVAPETTK